MPVPELFHFSPDIMRDPSFGYASIFPQSAISAALCAVPKDWFLALWWVQ